MPVSSADGRLEISPGALDRRGVAGTTVVLLSTLRTSVTCGPLCPGPTRTSTGSPGCTALMPLPARTLPCRKASPDPSDSSTNPNPFSGLNHFATARTGGPEGASKAVRLKRGRVPKARGCGAVGCCGAATAVAGSVGRGLPADACYRFRPDVGRWGDGQPILRKRARRTRP